MTSLNTPPVFMHDHELAQTAMTLERIAETRADTSTAVIEALLKDVTPGPWHWNVRGLVGPVSTDDDQSFGMICDEVAECTFSNGSKEANARFIAAARDLVPAITAQLTAMQSERDAALERVRVLTEALQPIADLTMKSEPEFKKLHPALNAELDKRSRWEWFYSLSDIAYAALQEQPK